MTEPDPRTDESASDLPGESGERIEAVQHRIDSARDAAGDALTDRAEETHPATPPPDAEAADDPATGES